MSEPAPIEKEIFIAAPPSEVFPYLTDPQKYLLWMGVSIDIDPTPGGHFRLDPNGRDVISGAYVEVTPPHRIVFTWGWDEPGHAMPAGASRVEIDLIPFEGGTKLLLKHFGVADPLRDPHVEGWRHYLSRLETVVAGHDPGPDPYATPEHRHG